MDFSKLKDAEFMRFKKNEYIVHAGEKSEYFYIIISGSCYRIKSNQLGKEIIMSTYSKGDILCACIAYYDSVTTSNFIAKTNMLVYRIPRLSFLEDMNNNPEIMKIFLEQVIRDYLDLSRYYNSNKSGKSANLLCSFILEHAKQNDAGKYLLSKEYTNVKLGMHLGIHEVTVNRILRVLKKENILERQKEGLIIHDVEKLKLFSDSIINIKY